MAQIEEKTTRSETKKVKELVEQADMARRLLSMAGVGPMTAFAIEASASDIMNSRRGSDFSAWLGLAARQHSKVARIGWDAS